MDGVFSGIYILHFFYNTSQCSGMDSIPSNCIKTMKVSWFCMTR